MRHGFGVSRPLSNGLPYDLIADTGGGLLRVQVKGAVVTGDTVSAGLASSKHHRGRRGRISYKGRVDLFAVVALEIGRVFVVDPSEVGNSIRLRLAPSKNNQAQGVRWAADYELSRWAAGLRRNGGV